MLWFIVRWALPLLLSAGVGWFGINKYTGTFAKARKAAQLEEELAIVQDQHTAEVAHLEKSFEDAITEVKQNADKTDARREHWRQAYYSEKQQHENKKSEFEEATKIWARQHYPSELD